MDNYVTCPRCNKTITNDPIIASAARGELHGSEYITCECGQNITFWAITAQLRDQNTFSRRVKKWWQRVTKSQA
jgi:hypothetical protein